MRWIAYIFVWLVAALFWTLAAGSSSRESPAEALPVGLFAMGSAGVMGVAVWWLTKRVPWDWRPASFYAVHGVAITIYSAIYSVSWMWPDLLTGRSATVVATLRSSPNVVLWDLLLGSWLYLIVVGISYAIRAQRRVRSQEAAAAEAILVAQQAQLAALRAQMNPHFLFNALHSVGALVTSDPVRADKALEDLGDLLRYALRTENEVLLAHEWQFVQDYLAFEQLRLGDLLTVDSHADAAALSVFVPPLILQPVVENAIRHGIADRVEGGRIELRATVEGKRLLLRVIDDGRGEANAGSGLGLASVRRRLDLLYGGRATLDISRLGVGFGVTIELPVKSLDDMDSVA